MSEFTWTERNAIAAAISIYQKFPGFEMPLCETGAWVIGITGTAGVGKSTLIKYLTKNFRKNALKVAVLAIDPSSEKDGWAILADRAQMRDKELDIDCGFFFRSLASHGEKSALTDALPKIICYSKMFSDIVMVETAGAGQTDVEIRSYVDTLVQVLAPLEGRLNLEKAGQKEHVDIFAVNDRESFTNTKQFFASASLALAQKNSRNWTKKIFLINAREKKGIAELVEGLYAHKKFLKDTQTAKP